MRLNAASKSRSCVSKRGRRTWRRRIDSSWRSTRISSSLARSLRPSSTTNSSRRQTTMYRPDASKGDLQQTGDADATAASAALALHLIEYLHPRAALATELRGESGATISRSLSEPPLSATVTPVRCARDPRAACGTDRSSLYRRRFTVMANAAVLVLPLESVAEHVTVLRPGRKRVPEPGLHATAREASALSVAVTL